MKDLDFAIVPARKSARVFVVFLALVLALDDSGRDDR